MLELLGIDLPTLIIDYIIVGFMVGMSVYQFTAGIGNRSKKVKDIALARGIICGIFCPVVVSLGAVALAVGAVVGVMYLIWKIPQGVWWTIKTAMKRVEED